MADELFMPNKRAALPQQSDEYLQRFRDAQNTRGRSVRRQAEIALQRERRNRPPKSPQQGGGGGPTPEQRAMVDWLVTNEASRYLATPPNNVGAGKPTPISKRIEGHRAQLRSETLALLPPDIEDRKAISEVFMGVFNNLIGGKDELQKQMPSKYFKDVPEPTYDMMDAQAVASHAEPPKKPNLPMPDIPIPPEGIKLDKNGKPRYAKDNPWGKRAGGFASAEHRGE